MKLWFAVGPHRCYQAIFCLVTLLCSAQGWAILNPAAGKVDEHYQWMQPQHPCSRAWQERLLIRGFSNDWQGRQSCRQAADLWWMLELKPKVRRSFHTRTKKNDNNEIIFEFGPDFYTRFNQLTREAYVGPPKWMPPSLAYWDAGIGDWRYLRHDIHMDLASEMVEPEMLMFWIKYESFEEGITWDASFDFTRLAELFGFAQLRLGSLANRMLQLFQLESDR